ncbi:MAG: hypothetical protein HY908_22785 [Myxococcales bacterium]|nr:hypothetical protein [Myxococcales bacterium]
MKRALAGGATGVGWSCAPGAHLAVGVAAALLGAAGCSGEEPAAPLLAMDFTSHAAYAAPLPSEHLREPDGTIDVSGLPNPDGNDLAARVIALLDGVEGFAATAGVFFAAEVPLDPASLPDLAGSVAAGAPLFLVGVEPAAPDFGVRYPVDVAFEADGGPFGAPNLLTALPLQGIPLRPGTRYALVVTTGVRAADGRALGTPPAVTALLEGGRPEGLADAAFAAYRDAIGALGTLGVDTGALAGLAVFETGRPADELQRFVEHARARPVPAPLVPFAKTDEFPTYCVYASRIALPVYQTGVPPYGSEGGAFGQAGDGTPLVDHEEESRVVVTVPRAAMPAAGWPTAVMIRTGGGGDRPLVDRGVEAVHGGPALVPGSGPAQDFASVGFAGLTFDGPHGGLRNVTNDDEQFLMFNVGNPAALRDNVRQSALEAALLPDVLAGLVLDVSDCPGAGAEARFDTGKLALMGHSMGATIAPLTLALEPRYGATILSGAGGSYIENVVYKLSPLAVKPLLEVLVGYAKIGRKLARHDALLSILQWAGEPADPPLYARAVVAEPAAGTAPRHVLMIQGIVDTYILPPIANATSLSLGLDLAGEALDASSPELADFRSLGELLRYSGGAAIALPASGNRVVGAHAATAVVRQHLEDGVEDGHEVMYQTAAPKHEYRCLLRSFAAGETPVVVDGAGELDPCP